jgi:hypothetical protein
LRRGGNATHFQLFSHGSAGRTGNCAIGQSAAAAAAELASGIGHQLPVYEAEEKAARGEKGRRFTKILPFEITDLKEKCLRRSIFGLILRKADDMNFSL